MIPPFGTLKCRFVPTKCLSMKERHPLSTETWKHRTSDGSIKAILLMIMILPESQSSHCYYWLTNIHFLLVDYNSFLLLCNNLPNLGAWKTNSLTLFMILWVSNSGRACLSSSGLESLMWLQSDASWGFSHLKAQMGWMSKMAHRAGIDASCWLGAQLGPKTRALTCGLSRMAISRWPDFYHGAWLLLECPKRANGGLPGLLWPSFEVTSTILY